MAMLAKWLHKIWKIADFLRPAILVVTNNGLQLFILFQNIDIPIVRDVQIAAQINVFNFAKYTVN